MHHLLSISFLHSLAYVSDSIFLGLKFFIPLLFVCIVLGVAIKDEVLEDFTTAGNFLILLGGMLFLAVILYNAVHAWMSGNESDRDLFMSFITGPYWFQLVIPFLNFGLLPNLMWVKRLRKSIVVSFIMAMWWHASYFLIRYLTGHLPFGNSGRIPASEYVAKSAVFLGILFVTCLVIFRKRQLSLSKNTDSDR